MKICHVITRLILGGAQENTILSCEGLVERGHAVTLISGPTTGPEGSLAGRARNGKYLFVECPHLVRAVRPVADLRAFLWLRRFFLNTRPDLVHTHSSKAGILARLAAWRAGVPVIVHTIHGMSFNRTQPPRVRAAYAAAERFCALRSAAIVSVAEAMTRQALAAGVGRPEQFVTVRSGMVVSDFDPARHDASEFRRQWDIRAGEVVIGTVARLFYNKGYEQLLDVMDRAVRVMPNLRFVWIGDGAARPHYEAELRRRGLRERTTLAGLVPPEQMPAMLAAVDLLAHTSQWEGLPRAVVQALLMEKPVVSFDIDGAPEVVIPGETGQIAPLNEIEAFTAALLRLAGDADLRRQCGRRGRARCVEAFDCRNMVAGLDNLYQKLIGLRGGGLDRAPRIGAAAGETAR